MSILRYMILASILWTFPSFILAYFSPVLSSALSYLTFLMLALYFVLIKQKGRILWIFILMGLSYYMIAGLNYLEGTVLAYVMTVIKYLILVVCGAEVLRKTSVEELYVILIAGGLSVVIHTIFFPLYNADFYPSYGRFSGFYLNPNLAGAMCLVGLALSFGVKNKILKYFGYLVFAAGGFFTFSRYFLAMFLVINLIMIFINKKLIIAPILGAVSLLLIFMFSSVLNLNNERFSALQDIFTGTHRQSGVKVLEENSRTETWARYKDIILSKPVLGVGYRKLQGKNNLGLNVGVHNTYLMVIGESGILPFLMLIGIYIFFLIKGFKSFNTTPLNLVMAMVLFTALLVSHTYFDSLSLLFMSIYFYITLTEESTDVTKEKYTEFSKNVSLV